MPTPFGVEEGNTAITLIRESTGRSCGVFRIPRTLRNNMHENREISTQSDLWIMSTAEKRGPG